MDDRERLEFPNLYDFFVRSGNAFKIAEIVNRKRNVENISLSLIDWFVTNYAKYYKTVYPMRGKPFDVYAEYRAQLLNYSKKYFDPFNREGPMLEIKYGANKEYSILTTFRQLNFLRWALKNGVVNHIKDNFDVINGIYKRIKEERTTRSNAVISRKSKSENVVFHRGKISYKFTY